MKQLHRKSLRIDGVFDIECAGWDSFVLGVTINAKGDTKVWYSAVAMVEHMMSVGGTWWSHNGGKYDMLCALDVICDKGIGQSISMSQSRITRSMGGGLMLRDSYALIPLGIEHMADISKSFVPKLWFDCKCSQECGGYCRITRNMPYYMRKRLEEYCIQDCQALINGLRAVQDFATEHDIDLCGTLGGSAWATVRRLLGIPDANFSSSQWTRIREAYYGGRCSVFHPIVHQSGKHWDIGSAYPSSLATSELPVGEFEELGSRNALRAMAMQRSGIYACTVNVPESRVPPLAWRWGEGLAFPVGQVSGAWSLPDILAAEANGCEVTAVHWGMVWRKESALFGDWVRGIYALRRSVGKDSSMGKLLKLFPNSLCGKFAERPDKRFVRMHPPIRDIVICSYKSPCNVESCSGVCGAWEQLDTWGRLWSVPFWKPSECGHVHWAAYLTAGLRAIHSAELTKHESDVVYCATDSLWTTSSREPDGSGDGLGEWSTRARFSEWEGVAPGAYAYTDADTGERIVIASGATLRSSDWTRGNAIQDRGVRSLVDAARAGGPLFQRAHRRWTLPRHGEWYGDRKLSADGWTRPVTVDELRSRLDERAGEQRERWARQG